jgi:MFS family permease
MPKIKAMPGFLLFWIGQVISLLGTNMTQFALTIWAYEKTGSATALALVGVSFLVPLLVLSPVAGALVDRSNRKFMMMISDLASGLVTITGLVLFLTGMLEVWHLYILGAVSGTFQAFQWPAFSAAISIMLPKEQYGRANGLMSLAESGSGIFAPILAGSLLGFIGLAGILIIDILTFIIAITALLFVFVPQPEISEEGQQASGSLWEESIFGFKYILEKHSLLGLQLLFMAGNFVTGIAFAVTAPMILASTGSNEIIFGTVSSVGAVGGLVGGLLMSAWGGPKQKIYGVIGGWAFASTFGLIMMGLANTLPVWAVSNFLGASMVPLINASNQSIWQAKVAPDLQGRVFSIRRLIAWFVNPLSMLIAGPLADYLLEPAFISGSGPLVDLFSPLVGTGPGAGMSVMFVLAGIGGLIVSAVGYMIPTIRNVETIMPDHDQDVKTAKNKSELQTA